MERKDIEIIEEWQIEFLRRDRVEFLTFWVTVGISLLGALIYGFRGDVFYVVWKTITFFVKLAWPILAVLAIAKAVHVIVDKHIQ